MNLKTIYSRLQNISQKRFFIPILLFLLIIPAFSFLLRPGIYWNMHDDMQLIRQLEMEKCFNDGQIPCRWTPDLGYGYGYPLFNFYPPLPYLVGQIFRVFGLSFVTSVKLTAIFQIILAAFSMYLLGSSLFGKIGGLLSALFYTYAPYHAVNIYVRGAMNEAWAAVFFPLIFYFSKKLISTKKIGFLLGLALSLSGLMLSHNPMLLIFSPFVLVWSLYWLFVSKRQKLTDLIPTIIKLALAVILGFGISAFFTLPVIFESSLTQIETMFTNYYTYAIHFVSLKQLFISNFWGDGPSVWGTDDGMPFSVGYLHWLLPLLIMIPLAFKFFKKRLNKLDTVVILLVLMAFGSTFMAHERSTFIWKLFPTLQKIQFPWRFLNISEFFFSLIPGFIAVIFGLKHEFKPRHFYLVSALIVALFILNISHFTPITYGPITDSQKFSGQAWINQVTGGIYDYLPKTASTAPKGPAKEYVDQIIPADVDYQLTGQKKGSDWQLFNIYLEKPAVVYLSVLAFPEFKIYDYQQPLAYQIEPLLGRISLNLDAGQHQIYLQLHNTPIRILGNLISLISIVFILFLSIRILKNDIHRRRTN